jgi:hypothetical protein
MNRHCISTVLAVVMLFVARGSQAGSIVYVAQLDGQSESPPNASPGIGFAEVDFDAVGHSMRVRVSFSGLVGTTVASHIHGPTATPGAGNAGVATQTPSFIGFPLGVMSGTYDNLFDTSLPSTYNPAFVTMVGGTDAAEVALGASLAAGTAYLNIHTTVYPAGEIRGFLQAVPEPGSIILLGIGALALLACGAGGSQPRPPS